MPWAACGCEHRLTTWPWTLLSPRAEGTQRIAQPGLRLRHKRTTRVRVSIITKANIIKTTDGKFLKICPG